MEALPASPRTSRTARALFALAALALAAAGGAYAWLWMFSGFQLYDDEGYFLVLVRQLLDGRRIYDEVSTVYGPAWLGYRWILNGLCGAPLTSDGVRFQSLAAWIACAVLAGLLVRQATRAQANSRWFALAAAGFALLHLSVFANEPGHPQDFAQLVLLGGLALFGALRERRALAAWLVLGLAVGLQGSTKVNLGVFLALPALLLCLPGRWSAVALAAALALPWVLMRTHLAESWAPALALVAGCGTLAAWSFREPAAEKRAWLGLGGGIALATLASVGFALACGSSLPGLWHALVLLPSRFTTEIVIGIRVPAAAAIVAPLALCLALLARARAGRAPAWLLSAAEIGFGAFTLLTYIPHPEWLIPYALPFSWIVLLRPETRRARLPLVLCAPLQALQVFPVSGSQEALGTILLVPLAAIALARSWRLLAAGTLLLLGLLLAHLGRGLWSNWQSGLERVALPGARWTRFEELTGSRARFLADTLRGSFDDFLGVRGDGSQYAWTGIAPATGVIISHSWRLFDERQQDELAQAYERAPRALVLDNKNPGRIPPALRAELPFFRMLARAYRPVAQCGSDVLCVRNDAPAPELRSCLVLPEGALHWPAGIAGLPLARLQVANLALRNLFADSAVADARFHPRLWDGAELIFDGRARPSVELARLARATALRLELPQPLPPEQAAFSSLRCFAADGARLCTLPVVLVTQAPR